MCSDFFPNGQDIVLRHAPRRPQCPFCCARVPIAQSIHTGLPLQVPRFSSAQNKPLTFG
ncbi:uncharacterized protein LAESUDRAFT_727723 [Laetiporus sulphureus 93-53]|uniref:Uncharacterized protein n=1 Tax=Laetiporus sulphureus 93-53 TaxID=1314785 RepID=A0A165DGX1_9APHY|nr:uncharacterized protein LAESUDRAFT_727723 [Laetiporus sulphureus 93-53]KZT04854.1 hypothetical protein LAESUDRAFT_727723 [Laetiporus sulphureus 93-53]